jgi:hypothetical protein
VGSTGHVVTREVRGMPGSRCGSHVRGIGVVPGNGSGNAEGATDCVTPVICSPPRHPSSYVPLAPVGLEAKTELTISCIVAKLTLM